MSDLYTFFLINKVINTVFWPLFFVLSSISSTITAVFRVIRLFESLTVTIKVQCVSWTPCYIAFYLISALFKLPKMVLRIKLLHHGGVFCADEQHSLTQSMIWWFRSADRCVCPTEDWRIKTAAWTSLQETDSWTWSSLWPRRHLDQVRPQPCLRSLRCLMYRFHTVCIITVFITASEFLIHWWLMFLYYYFTLLTGSFWVKLHSWNSFNNINQHAVVTPQSFQLVTQTTNIQNQI